MNSDSQKSHTAVMLPCILSGFKRTNILLKSFTSLCDFWVNGSIDRDFPGHRFSDVQLS